MGPAKRQPKHSFLSSKRFAFITSAVIAGVFAIAGCAPSFGQDQAQPRTWVLVIGISQYSKLPGGQQLLDAENDARAFANVLQARSNIDLKNMWLMIGPAATQTAIKTGLGSWLARQSSEQDTVYIFFSGHAVVDREFGAPYWLAYDSDPKNVDATAISLDDLKHSLGRVKAGRIIIIQDSIRRDFFDPASNGPADTASLERGLGELAKSRPGLTCLVASGPGEFSREGRRWSDLGVFTKMLVDGLSGRADRNKDGIVTTDELFDWLSERIPQETSQKQHPWRTQDNYVAIAMSRPHSLPTSMGQMNMSTHAAAAGGEKIEGGSDSAGNVDATQSAGPGGDKPASPKVETTAPNRPEQVTTIVDEGPRRHGAASKPSSSVQPGGDGPSNGTSKSAEASPASSPGQSAPLNQSAAKSDESNEPVGGSASAAASTASHPAPVAEAPHHPASPPAISSVPSVSGESNHGSKPTDVGSVPDAKPGKAPSPLPSELEAAIAAGRLIEPKGANAWDLYQRIESDSSSSEIVRLRDLLASALFQASKAIVEGEALQGSLEAKADDFKRAGDMLVRFHTLQPLDKGTAVLEKLSAIENLIALEFYSDAERRLSDIPAPVTAPVENAHGLIYLGQFSDWQAERTFKRAVALDPTLAAPHYNLGMLYKKQGNDSALAEFEQAAQLAPANAQIQATVGDEYFARSRWAEAQVAYQQAIAADPGNDALHTKLGHSLYSQGLREEADREYKKAKELGERNR